MRMNSILASKAHEYAKFDYKRMPRIYEAIKNKLKIPKIIHIIGTNGKGSTGRFLAYYLFKKGFNVGHFTSPHILDIKERFWQNGEIAKEKSLQIANKKLLKLLSASQLQELSYFEYLTFLAIIYFQNVDYLILEAGLGGEYDSTTVFDNILTLITPIGLDHQEFLGNSVEQIATTKLKAIKKEAIIAKQTNKKVDKIAKKIDKKILSYKKYFSKKEIKEIKKFIKRKKFASFQKTNLLLALSAVKFLNIKIDLKLLSNFIFFGRAQKICNNILVDVGHNKMAAKEMVKIYKNKKVILLYNTLFDKDYIGVLETLKPIVKRIEVIKVKSHRTLKKKILKKSIERLDIEYKNFKKIKKSEKYLVFGSFLVVGEFLEKYER